VVVEQKLQVDQWDILMVLVVLVLLLLDTLVLKEDLVVLIVLLVDIHITPLHHLVHTQHKGKLKWRILLKLETE
jgi:hypothetical protein